jgi:integrase
MDSRRARASAGLFNAAEGLDLGDLGIGQGGDVADVGTHLQSQITERGGGPYDAVFPSRRGTALSTDAVEKLVAKHSAAAAKACDTLTDKQVTPHTLRHSAAMSLLHAGVDSSVISLWLGHESPAASKIYLHADMTLKEQALERITPPSSKPGRYTAPDTVLAFLDSL